VRSRGRTRRLEPRGVQSDSGGLDWFNP